MGRGLGEKSLAFWTYSRQGITRPVERWLLGLNTSVLACLCTQGNVLRFVQMTNIYLPFPATFRNKYSFPEGFVCIQECTYFKARCGFLFPTSGFNYFTYVVALLQTFDFWNVVRTFQFENICCSLRLCIKFCCYILRSHFGFSPSRCVSAVFIPSICIKWWHHELNFSRILGWVSNTREPASLSLRFY